MSSSDFTVNVILGLDPGIQPTQLFDQLNIIFYTLNMNLTLYSIVSFCIILIFSIVLSLQDIKKMTVGIYIQGASIFAALTCHLIFTREMMWIYILSSMIIGCFYFAVRKITKNKLGPADVWFGFFQGLFLTPILIPICLAIESIAALIIINKKFGKERFPFIPFMSLGLIASYIIGLTNIIKF